MKNISFVFEAKRDSNTNMINVSAWLENKNSDTVYFHSRSCDGVKHSVVYDTALFEHTNFIMCNASWPIIVKIAPKSKLNIDLDFEQKRETKKIKLAYAFFICDEKGKPEPSIQTEFYGRPIDQQFLIGGQEKDIK